MGRYCIYCGAPLKDETNKCGFCGKMNPHQEMSHASYKDINTSNNTKCNCSPNLTLFSLDDWSERYKQESEKENDFGLILTDSSKLTDKVTFENNMRSFIEFKEKEHVSYYLLDLATQRVRQTELIDVPNMVTLLRYIYKVAVPNYLLIFGNERVIPSSLFPNKIKKEDLNVLSDLPYFTLSCASPWSGQNYLFCSNDTKVGRIPTSVENEFKVGYAYLDNVKKFTPFDELDMFEYSAYEFMFSSKALAMQFKHDYYTSPEFASSREWLNVGCRDIREKLEGYNYYSFNLHGGETGFDWYGQNANDYPIAFSPDCLPKSGKPYLICAEACYGAKPNDENSTVCTALKNGAMGFVGSSRIAYGGSGRYLTCADLVSYNYLKNVNAGETLGSAFITALGSVYLSYYYLTKVDEASVKTIAEFMLYGDPSLRFIASKTKGVFKKTKSEISKTKDDPSCAFNFLSFDKNGHIKPLEEEGVTSKGIFNIDAKEKAKIENMAKIAYNASNDYVKEKYEDFSNDEPLLYKVVGHDGFRAIYNKNVGEIKQVLQVYFDENGKEIRTYISR